MEPLDAYRDYTRNVLRLMIHFAWRQAQQDPTSIVGVFDHQVDIRRKTTIGVRRGKAPDEQPQVEWVALRDELAARVTRHTDSDTRLLEDDAWRLLAPLVEPVLEQTWPRSWRHMDRPYRCWTYDLSHEQPEAITIHIENAYQPRSPLGARRRDFATTLLRLCDDVRAADPQVTTVRCGSWLNSFPPFYTLFPSQWHESLVLSEVTGANWGWWGQYMTHEGAFHHRNAGVLRATGRHPYWAGWSQCGIEALVRHLRSTLA